MRIACVVRVVVALAWAVPAAAQTDMAAQGARLLLPFKQELQQALQHALTQGPEQAVEVCSQQAPRLAARFSGNGIEMGRSSHLLRNPANAPQAWLAPVLARYAQTVHHAAPTVHLLGDGRQAYVEPIYIKPLCLLCHGQSPPATVARAIARRYPDDRAVGFQPGQFRGVFWVVFPAAADPS